MAIDDNTTIPEIGFDLPDEKLCGLLNFPYIRALKEAHDRLCNGIAVDVGELAGRWEKASHLFAAFDRLAAADRESRLSSYNNSKLAALSGAFSYEPARRDFNERCAPRFLEMFSSSTDSVQRYVDDFLVEVVDEYVKAAEYWQDDPDAGPYFETSAEQNIDYFLNYRTGLEFIVRGLSRLAASESIPWSGAGLDKVRAALDKGDEMARPLLALESRYVIRMDEWPNMGYWFGPGFWWARSPEQWSEDLRRGHASRHLLDKAKDAGIR